MIITYLLVGVALWLIYAFIASRTQGECEETEFVGGLIMSAIFWPLFIAGLVFFYVVVALMMLVSPRR